MKVYISNYRHHWISPYTILEKVFFWKEIDYDDPLIDKLSKLINPVSVAIDKILNVVHPKVDYVKIDRWDTWSMDRTLGLIALPMLKQLKNNKLGACLVDDSDVPDELKSINAPKPESEYEVDGNHFKRWDYVLDEMIFAFEHVVDDDWEKKYQSGEFDFRHVPVDENGNEVDKKDAKFYELQKGPNHTFVSDDEAIKKVYERVDRGLLLFGKYYRNLWD